MPLNYNPSATFKTSIRELEGTDQLVPENFNPQFQDLLNNTGLLNDRLGSLEGANLPARMTTAEGNITTLQGRATSAENRLTSAEGRLNTYDALNIATRLANLETYKRFYSSSETPPYTAPPGTIWLKDAYLLVKVDNISDSAARWRSITPYGFGLAFKDLLGDGESQYRDVPLPSSIAGLTVLRAIPNGIEIVPGSSGASVVYIGVFWKVPPTATVGANAEPTAGTTIYSFAAGGDALSAVTFHNAAELLPGERLWIKLGFTGFLGQGDAWCNVYTPLTLELRQG